MRLLGRRGRSGFSMMEVLVAMLLALIMALGLLRMNLASRYMMRNSRVVLEATNVLQTYMEMQRTLAWAGLVDQAYNDIVVSNTGTADAADDILGDVTIDVTDNGDDTKTVLGTLAWTQRMMGQEINRNISSTTMIADI